MTQTTAGFETGVSGNNISTGDAGDATAWDAVTVAANGSAKYDNAHVKFGSLAAKFQSVTAAPCTAYVAWTTALGTVVDHYGRAYVWPNENWQTTGFIRWFSGASAFAAGLYLTGTNTIQLRDAANVSQATTPSIGTGAWVRIEWHVVHSLTVGQIEVKLFTGANVDGTVADSTTTTAANLNIDTDMREARYGIQSSDFPISVWLDGIVEGATSYPGPFVPSSALASDTPFPMMGRGATW